MNEEKIHYGISNGTDEVEFVADTYAELLDQVARYRGTTSEQLKADPQFVDMLGLGWLFRKAQDEARDLAAYQKAYANPGTWVPIEGKK